MQNISREWQNADDFGSRDWCNRREEDGVDNSGVDNSLLYTQPEDVAYTYEKLKAISDNFTIAAAFGNVHGVYKP